MAHFAGDINPKTGQPYKANSMFQNFIYDLTFQESKCVWKNRKQLESYFLIMAVVFCWTIIVPIIKLKLYFESRSKSDHR